MRPSTIRYFVREGFSGLRKNLLMTMASMVAVAACISILSFSYCVGSNLQYMLSQMEDSIGISVFLNGELTGEEIEKMKNQISKIEHVESVEYISPGDALDSLKKDWGADEDIFVGLDETNNPLSHSFQVSLDSIENQSGVLEALERVEGIDNIRHGQTETEVLMKANNVFRVASVLVMLVLGMISVMIIMNTIRISVVNRRVEINIMKYVGATDSFIRLPFFVEGFLLGLLSALIAFGLLWIGYNYVLQTIADSPATLIRSVIGSTLAFEDVALKMFAWFAGGGIGIGVFGSMFFVNRYLKV